MCAALNGNLKQAWTSLAQMRSRGCSESRPFQLASSREQLVRRSRSASARAKRRSSRGARIIDAQASDGELNIWACVESIAAERRLSPPQASPHGGGVVASRDSLIPDIRFRAMKYVRTFWGGHSFERMSRISTPVHAVQSDTAAKRGGTRLRLLSMIRNCRRRRCHTSRRERRDHDRPGIVADDRPGERIGLAMQLRGR